MDAATDTGTANGEIEGGGGSGQDSMGDDTKDGFNFLWSLRKYLVLLGILAVTVTYNSGLTPPGGFWNKTKDGHQAGDPALHVEFSQRYEVFFYCNATAFAASIVLIILLLSKNVTKKKLWLRSMQFTMLVDLFSLMGAYASGSCRALKSSIYTWVLVIIVFAYVWIHILVSTRIVPETLKKEVKMMVDKTLSKLSIPDMHPSSRQEKKDLDEAQKFILMLVTATDMPADSTSEQSLLVGDYNGVTNGSIEDGSPSLPAKVSGIKESAQEHNLISCNNSDIENGGINNSAEHGNGHIDSYHESSGSNSTEEHLEKTRTYLLLLAILAVSLTYQSGLNPPGGFWSKREKNHLIGDRILEDSDHPRFISFFYLNAIAFVASIFIIVMLLNKSVSKKVTKHRVLQVAMIVDLLSLTGAFVLGSSRDAKKSISVSVLLFLVLAYVALHVRIAIHVIPLEWKKQISEKLLLCGNMSSALPWLSHNQKEKEISPKELERRRNLLLTLAILAATVTYQAGINPPGGVWSDDKGVSGMPGTPILQDSHPRRYDVFYYSNSVSFVSSVAITILLLNKESFEHGIKSYALRVCLVVGLLGLLVAYAAGSSRNRKQSIFVIIIAVAVLISLVVQVLLSSMHSTLGRPLAQLMECLQKLMEYLQGRVFHTGKRQITSELLETKDPDQKIARKRHKYLMLIATLAASVTYQAGLNPPGGFWSDDDRHKAGDPVLHDINHKRYKTFFCFNAISFMASIVVIMLLLSKSIRKKDVPLEVLFMIMILDLLSLMTAFAAGSCRKFSTSIYIFLLVAGVVIYLVVLIILSKAIKTCLRKWKAGGVFSYRRPERVT
ncbi:unnamed protein product [Urochloa decumbens]|uniref:PGG domain-containing protein n=1 Tax=Urochloa decumbens TaxID=240449 RepID=A0ABC9E7Q0_9POAL